MYKIFSFIILCFLVINISAQNQKVKTALQKVLDNMAQPLVENDSNVGIAVGIYQRNRENQVFFYGFADKEKKKTLDENTIFEIGSISKTFTGITLAYLIEEKKLNFTDGIDNFVSGNFEFDSQKITLEHLTTHTSCLPTIPTNLDPKNQENPYADYTYQQMDTFLKSYVLQQKPGEQYEYSNLAVGLLGRILEIKTQKSYEQLIQEVIYNPFGMKDTYIHIPSENKERFAQGYDMDGNRTSYWDIPTLAGAGAIRSTVQDMMRYIAFNIEAHKVEEKSTLQRAIVLSHGKRKDVSPEIGIAMGWHTIQDKIVWHNGGTGGFRSFLGFDLDNDLGVVVLSNSANSIDILALNILLFLKNEKLKPLKVRETISIDRQTYQKYLGKYELNSMVIDMGEENGKLMVQFADQPKFHIYPESETKFFAKVTDIQFEFIKNEDGNVDKVILHEMGQKVSASKIK